MVQFREKTSLSCSDPSSSASVFFVTLSIVVLFEQLPPCLVKLTSELGPERLSCRTHSSKPFTR